MAIGVNSDLFKLGGLVPGERIELDDPLDILAEHGNTPGAVFRMGGEYFDDVATDAEIAALERLVVAPVLQLDEVFQQCALIDRGFLIEIKRHRRIGLRRADAVDARDRGDDHHIAALQQRARGGVTHAVDLLVDRSVFLDIGIGARHIGLGLVVIVIGDKIFHRVTGEERFHFAIKLGR